MNGHHLEKLGLPQYLHKFAFVGINSAVKAGEFRGKTSIKERVGQVVASPKLFVGDQYFGDLAKAIIEDQEFVAPPPCDYKVWGDIDQGTKAQMDACSKIPVAAVGAVMCDNHLGYGLCIGGVLATRNAVVPYGVGVDIACRVKMTVLDIPVENIEKKSHDFDDAINNGTRFGVGGFHEKRQNHPVMDEDWGITRITDKLKDKAHDQLGTSGSGNHFIDIGVLTLESPQLGLEAGQYVAVLTHSGSRGTGAQVCSTYLGIAQANLPSKYKQLLAENGIDRMAWLGMDTQEGQDYWNAMNLMGQYAAANHDVIHRLVSKSLGGHIIADVENHHNFAWKEVHNGEELYVHRKGATPAGVGVKGIIAGSMGTPAYVVSGKGNPASLNSASHGAGRAMSRKAARDKYTFNSVRNDLAKKGIRVLAAGADEVPLAYKDITKVMSEQTDLLDVIGRFDPKIVKMSDDGKNED